MGPRVAPNRGIGLAPVLCVLLGLLSTAVAQTTYTYNWNYDGICGSRCYYYVYDYCQYYSLSVSNWYYHYIYSGEAASTTFSLNLPADKIVSKVSITFQVLQSYMGFTFYFNDGTYSLDNGYQSSWCQQSTVELNSPNTWTSVAGIKDGTNTLYVRTGYYLFWYRQTMTVTVSDKSCPAGYFLDSTGCNACPAGRYKSVAGSGGSSSCLACPAGKFGTKQAETRSTCEGDCDLGYYCACTNGCTSRAPTGMQCPRGRFGGQTGLGTSACSGTCDAGVYCPLGSVSGTNSASSLLCRAGSYGLAGGAYTDDTCAGPCNAGYICPSPGATSATFRRCGDDASLTTDAQRNQFFCPQGSSVRKPVDAGFIALNLDGTSYTNYAQTQCPVGSYCSGGVQTACPIGRYGGALGMSVSTCTSTCDAGYYCPAGSTNPRAEDCGGKGPSTCISNPVQCYCPAGTTTRIVAASSGVYTTPTSASEKNRQDVANCPSGVVCSNGVMLPTVQWTNCANGQTTVAVDENLASGVKSFDSPITTNKPSGTTYTLSNLVRPSADCPDPVFGVGSTTGQLTVTNTIDFEQCPFFRVQLNANDGVATITCSVTITVNDQNDAPSISSCGTRRVAEDASQLSPIGDPVVGTDPDRGQSLSYSIVSVTPNENNIRISRCNGQLTVGGAFNSLVTKSYSLVVRVNDDGNPSLSAQCSITVAIDPINHPPVMSARSVSVAENTGIGTLVTTLSCTDPNGDAVTYRLSKADAVDAFNVDANTGRVTVKGVGGSSASPLDFETRPQFSMTVTCTDAFGKSVDAALTVSITDVNDAPVLQWTGSFRVPEGTYAVATNVGNPFTSFDQDSADAGTHRYSVTPTTFFGINAVSGQLFVQAGVTFDFEAVSSYSITVTTTDRTGTGLSGSASITVFIDDVNEAPRFIGTPYSFSVPENSPFGTAVGTVAGNDPDGGQTISFSITGGTGSAMFGIESGTGNIFVRSAGLDFESVKSYTLTVQVRDSWWSPLTASTTVNIAVTDVNEPPVMADSVRQVNENSAPGTVIGTLSAVDPESGTTGLTFTIVDGNDGTTFALSASGQLSVANSRLLDYEGSKRQFVMTVQVKDASGLATTAKLTVNVLNVNEPPVLNGMAPVAIQELSAVGTALAKLTATDPEGDPITYALVAASDTNGYWQVAASTGDITVKKTLPDVGPTGLGLTPQFTASDGLLTSATLTISVTIQDLNRPPTIAAQTRSVPESASIATQVGAPLTANDPDGDPLTFSITNDVPFNIDGSSGQLTVKAPLDFETRSTYAVTVQVSDYNTARKDSQGLPLPGLTASNTITVNILDVNEAPSLAPATYSVDEDARTGFAVATLAGTEPDVGQSSQLIYTILTTPSPFIMDGAVLRAYGYPAVSDNTIPAGYVLLAANAQIGGASVLPGITTRAVGTFTRVLARYKSGYVTCDTAAYGSSTTTFKWNGCAPHSSCSAGRCFAFELRKNSQYVLEMPNWFTLPSACTPPSTPTGDIICDVNLSLINGDVLTTTWFEPSHATSTSDNGGVLTLDLYGLFRPSGETIDFEKRSSYALSVQVADPGGLSGTGVVTVNVNNVNEAPWFDPASRTVSIKEDATVGQLVTGLSVFDQDAGDSSTFSILAGNDQGRFTIDASNQVTVAAGLDFETVKSYTLTIQARDKGGLVAILVLTIAIIDVNEAPVISVPASSTIPENSAAGTVAFTVSAVDPDAGNPGFTWSIISGNNFDAFQIVPTGAGSTAQITVKTPTALDFENSARKSYSLVIRVTDSGKLYSEGTVQVAVTDVNEAPTLAAMTASVPEMSAVDTLVIDLASGTTDPDAGQTFTYSIVTLDGASLFKISGSRILMATATLDYESRQMAGFQYVLGVQVRDSGTPQLSAQASITVQILDVNEPPVIAAGTRSVLENSPTRTLVGDPITASDPDLNQLLKFAITAGDPTGIFKINSCSGQIEVVQAVLDFEGPSPSYTLTITVTDDGTPRLSSSATYVITVTDVNEAPVVQSATMTIAENSLTGTTIGTPVVATDPDNAKVPNTQKLRYSIVAGNTGDLFSINANTGQLSVNKVVLDFESPLNSYRITVQATDDSVTNPLSGTNDIFITVTDVNEAPLFGAQTISVDENSVAGTPVLPQLACTDPDLYRNTVLTITRTSAANTFAVSTAGLTTVIDQSALNFEVAPTLSFTARCCDNDASPLCTSATITVQVKDVNEAPTLSPATVSVPENVPVGTAVGNAIKGQDVDAGQTLTYRIVTQPVAGLFRIDALTGQIEVATAALDFEARNSYAMTVEVKDSGVPSLSATATITVLVIDVNEPPVLGALTVTRLVSELANAATLVGSRVTATDVDANDAVTFSITAGNSAGFFAIDAATGQIRLAKAGLDFETTPSYTLTVTATDKGGLSTSGSVVITVGDENEAPFFTAATFTMAAAENSATGTAIGRATALDVDAADVGALRYTLRSDSSSGRFSVDANDGTIRVARSLVQTAGTTFNLVVQVADKAGLTATATVALTVTNANWPPVLLPASRTIAENSPAGTALGAPIVGTDQNLDQTLTYSILEGSFNWNSVVQINANTGQLTCRSTPFDFELMATYTITVQAMDNGVPPLAATAVVTITVTDVNEVPTVQPAVLSINENSAPADIVGLVTATDPDSYDAGKLTFSIVSGNTGDAFAIASSGLLFVKRPVLNFEALPKYSLGVTARDLGGLVSAVTIITVTLIDVNDPPVFPSGPYSRSVPENSAVGTLVGTAVTAVDEDVGQKLTYTFTSGNANGAFAVSGTGQITVASTAALNFEVTPSYTLTLQVVDDGPNPVPAVTTVQVTVLDVNEVPVFPSAETVRNVNENVAVGTLVSGGVVTATDVDANQFLTYAIAGGSDIFKIDSSTGQLSVITAALDFETRNQYVIQVTATDSGIPPLTATIKVTININDVNERPTFNPATVSVPENSATGTLVGLPVQGSDVDAGQTLTYSIVSADVALTSFTIVAATGQIQVGAISLDFETRDTYALIVRATDNGTPSLFAQATVTVKVTDVNEAPVINDAVRAVDENSLPGVYIGTPLPAFDPDRDQLLVFSITDGNTGQRFKIDACSGQLMVAKNALNYEVQNQYIITVTVYDNGVPALSDTAVITININDVNEPPSLADTTLSVDENSPVRTPVGARLVGTDPDFGQAAKLKYAIVDGNKDSTFGVNATTGQIFVARAVLDFETLNQYTLTVSVTDSGEPVLSSTAKVTVFVNDVNEAPVFLPTTRNVAENVASGTLVGAPVTGVDPDKGAVVSYRIVSGSTKFSIFPTSGQLWVSTATLDYETQNVYTVVVGCSDGLLETVATITIQIDDVNEPPSIVDQTRYINENSPANSPVGAPIVATDPDVSPPERLLFAITGGDNTTLWSMDAYTGQISLRTASLNFEDAWSPNQFRPGRYLLQVTVQDKLGIARTATVTVQVQNVNDPPTMSQSQVLFISENVPTGTAATGRVIAQDEDAGDSISFAITGGTGNSIFAIGRSTGVVTFTGTVLDFETTPSLTLQVTATDNSNATTTAIVTVTVINVNEAPVITAQTRSIPEQQPLGTAVGSPLSVSDPDAGDRMTFAITSGNSAGHFSINPSTGQIILAKDKALFFNGASTTQYSLGVTVMDLGGLTATATITISILDVNDPPVISTLNPVYFVDENSPVGTTLGILAATDPEGTAIVWSIVNDNKYFAVGASTGILTVNKDVLNFEVDRQYLLTLQAADSSPDQMTATTTVTINVRDINERPVFLAQSRSVNENSPQYTFIGEPLIATDQDAGSNGAIDFTITAGNSLNLFTIDSRTGQLYVNRPLLDFERTPSYTLSVRAQDRGVPPLNAVATITIVILDVNDPPSLDDISFSVPENRALGEVVGVQLKAYDQDRLDTLTYRITGPNCWPTVVPTPRNVYSMVELQQLPAGAVSGTFRALGLDGVLLGLFTTTKSPSSMYEILINFASVTIRRGAQAVTALVRVDIPTADVLTDIEYRTFWFSVNGNTISVGTGAQVGAAGTVLATAVDPGTTLSLAFVGVGHSTPDPVTIPAVCFNLPAGQLSGADWFDLKPATGQFAMLRAGLDFESIREYSFEVTVTDSGGLTDTGIVRVSVSDVNEAPWFTDECTDSSFIGCFTVPENSAIGTRVVSSFMGATKPNGVGGGDPDTVAQQTVSFSLSDVGNLNKAFTINAATGVISVATAGVLNFESPNNVFVLTVGITDSAAVPITTWAQVQVVLTDVNESPQFADTSRSVRESTGAAIDDNGSVVGTLVGTLLVATDVDSSSKPFGQLSYSIVSGNDFGIFSITAGGQLSVAKAVLNFEDTTRNRFVLGVRATDGGGLFAAASVTVLVTDVNEAPVISAAIRQVPENSISGTLIGDPLPASDVDIGQFLTYSIVASDSPGVFKISPCSGQLEVSLATLDFETKSTYTLTVQVMDDGMDPPHLTAAAQITIQIQDVNEPPNLDDAQRWVDENSKLNTLVGLPVVGTDPDRNQVLTYSIRSGNDLGYFGIRADSGQIYCAVDKALDFETWATYNLVVRATDNGKPSLFDDAKVTINVNDVNEPPVMSNTVRSIDENSNVGTFVGAPLTASDPEVNAGRQKLTWRIVSGNANGVFALDASSGQLSVARAVLDFETVPTYTLRINVTDNGVNLLSAVADVVIQLNDINEPPTIQDATRSVFEDAPSGQLVGAPIPASDPEKLPLLFTIVAGNEAQVFLIDNFGQLRIDKTARLDFETLNPPVFTLQVMVTDAGTNGRNRLTDVAVVTINVLNVNEAPVMGSFTRTVRENSPVGTLVGDPVTGTDVDAGDTAKLVYSMSLPAVAFTNDNKPLFAIAAATGQISVATAGLDFEALATYTVTVTATDPGGLSSSAPTIINLLNVNEAPSVRSPDGQFSVHEHARVGLAACTDPPIIACAMVASDPDAGDKLTFAITDSAWCKDTSDSSCTPEAGVFVIDAQGSLLLRNNRTSSLRYPNRYRLTIQVTDLGGLTSSTVTYVAVSNFNLPPEFRPVALRVNENSPVGTVVSGIVLAVDADVDAAGKSQTLTYTLKSWASLFELRPIAGGTGGAAQLVVKNAVLDFETTPVYMVQIMVVDSGSPPKGATATFQVYVDDVNEAPTIAAAVRAVAENSPVGTSVGDPILGQDVDAGDTRTYSIVAATAGDAQPFRVDPISGQITVAQAVLDFEARKSYDLIMTVTDRGGLKASAALTINVINVNEKPVLVAQTFSSVENVPRDTFIGRVIASDPDALAITTTLTYSLVAVDAYGDNVFTIAHDTGIIRVLTPALDFEDREFYRLTVTVTDDGPGDKLSTSALITVNVIDVNDLTLTGFTMERNSLTAQDVRFPSLGGTWVRLLGTNMGKKDFTAPKPVIVATYQSIVSGQVAGPVYTATSCLVVTANVAIECLTAPGAGSNLVWSLAVGRWNTTSTVTTAYKAPAITAALYADALPTVGGSVFTLTGTDFGPASSRVAVQYQTFGRTYTATGCRVIDHGTLQCTSVPGVGSAIRFAVTLPTTPASQSSPFTLTTASYAVPTITNIERGANSNSLNALVTSGGDAVVITGTDFGPAGFVGAVAASYGMTTVTPMRLYAAAACQVTVAHTRMVCLTSPGIGSGHAWRVSVGSIASPWSSQRTSYAGPRILTVGGVGFINANTEGGQSLVLTGSNFGPVLTADFAGNAALYGAPVVSYGGAKATGYQGGNCSVTAAHTQITCVTSPGTGRGHAIVVSIGGQSAPVMAANMAYAAPVVVAFTGAGAVNGQTPGGEEVLIEGRQFGFDNSKIQQVTYGDDGKMFDVSGKCRIVVPHRQLRCVTTEGAGAALKWIIVVDGQESGAPTTFYEHPTILGVSGPGVKDASTNGGQAIEITGLNFGPPSHPQFLEAVTYGPTSTEYNPLRSCRVVSHTKIACVSRPGVGQGQTWSVKIRGQRSGAASEVISSYEVPVIQTLSVNRAPTDGGTVVTVTGTGFGLVSMLELKTSDLSLKFGGLVIPSSELREFRYVTAAGETFTNATFVVPSTRHQFKFVVPEALDLGRQRDVIVQVIGVNRAITESAAVPFYYQDPNIIGVYPIVDRTTNTQILGIEGTNFGRINEVVVTVGGVDQVLLNCNRESHSYISCVFPGISGTARVERGQQVSNRVTFLRRAAEIANLASSDVPADLKFFDTAGGEKLTISGYEFPEDITQLNITVGGRGCRVTGTLQKVATPAGDLFTVNCLVPEGQGTDVPVIITSYGQRSPSRPINYEAPFIASVMPAAGPTSGVDDLGKPLSVKLIGRNFGIKDQTAVMYRPDGSVHAALTCKWTHTQAECNMPEGAGSGMYFGIFTPPDIEDDPRGQYRHQSEFEAYNNRVAAADRLDFKPSYGRADGARVRFAYQLPLVTRVEIPANAHTRGGYTVTLHGKNFGNSDFPLRVLVGRVAVGRLLAGASSGDLECIVTYRAHNSINCTMPAGEGSNLQFKVTVAGLTNTPNAVHTFSYLVPTLNSISPTRADTQAIDAQGRPLNLTLIGKNFGRSGRVWMQPDPDDTLKEAQSLPVLLWTHERIVAQLIPEQGQKRRVLVETGTQFSSQTVLFSFNPPWLNYTMSDTSSFAYKSDRFPTKGNYKVTLYGSSFGLPNRGLYITLAGTPVTIVEGSHRHTSVTFMMPPGIGTKLPLVLYVGASESTPLLMAYDPPRIDYVRPFPANAEGEQIQLFGANFGAPGLTTGLTILLDEMNCTNAVVIKGTRGDNDYLQCDLQRQRVGFKNVTIDVANQVRKYIDTNLLRTRCPPGKYGQPGELCLDCPVGAVCKGTAHPKWPSMEAEPVSIGGWWLKNVTDQLDLCPPERLTTRLYLPGPNGKQVLLPHCPYALPCEPQAACNGSNICNTGYTGDRCALCAPRYYRRTGECVTCPDNPLLLVIGFLVAAIVLCIAGYFLNKKAVNLAFISIGVDYFQVLAMFANSKIKWPYYIKYMFTLMSVFNFNLEITAPECSIPDLGYKLKWTFIEVLPLAAGSIFLMLHFAYYFKKRCIQGRRKGLHSHASALIGTGLVLFYYMYLYLTRTSLDVFNCSPTDPPDGHEYLQVVFERCDEPGGIHKTLLFFAIGSFIFYTLGYPTLVATILYRNRLLVMEDQLLRAKGTGTTRLDNPNAYDIRKRFHKIYYHFKPDNWYWVLVIIARKLGIATTALMFNKTPAFQLSMALLVMFAAYAAQVRYSPYMSPSEYGEVLRLHELAAKDPSSPHSALAKTLAHIQDRGRKQTKKFSWNAGAGAAARAAANFFWSYNTVEAVLLACAVLVNLAGVMFESGRFDTDYYQTQQDVITMVTMFIIGSSLVYFATVFLSEVYTTIKKPAPKDAKDGEKKKVSRRHSLFGTSPKLDDSPAADQDAVVASGGLNPLFLTKQAGLSADDLLARDELPNARAWEAIRARHVEMTTELSELKKKVQMFESGATVSSTGEGEKPKVTPNRIQFGPRRAGAAAAGSSRSARGGRSNRNLAAQKPAGTAVPL